MVSLILFATFATAKKFPHKTIQHTIVRTNETCCYKIRCRVNGAFFIAPLAKALTFLCILIDLSDGKSTPQKLNLWKCENEFQQKWVIPFSVSCHKTVDLDEDELKSPGSPKVQNIFNGSWGILKLALDEFIHSFYRHDSRVYGRIACIILITQLVLLLVVSRQHQLLKGL